MKKILFIFVLSFLSSTLALSFYFKVKALIEIHQPCEFTSGAFDITEGEYNINIDRAHAYSSTGPGSIDIGANNVQPANGNLYQKCIDDKAIAAIIGTARHKYDSSCGGHTYISVENSSGIVVDYVHIDIEAGNTVGDGEIVDLGETIGTISDKGCADFKHIHLNVWKDNIKQNYSQWEFKPIQSCNPPVIGIWTISDYCQLNANADVLDNILIESQGVLKVNNDIELDFDFNNHRININQGGKLIIKPGAKVF